MFKDLEENMNIMIGTEDVNKRPSGTFRDLKNTVSEIKILLKSWK